MERRLAAVLSYDVVGYSRAMGLDEASTLDALKSHRREVIDPGAARNAGRTIKLMGDGGLMEFASVVDAVAFAVGMQNALAEHNAALPEERRLEYRIGINIGDVIVEGDDIYGDGVNIAARLEALAEPGGICVRRNVRNQVRGKLDIDFEDLGEVEVKNIDRLVRAFKVVMNAKAAALAGVPAGRSPTPKRNLSLPWIGAVIAVLVLAIIGLGWWQPWASDFQPVDPEEMALPLPEKPSIAVLAFEDHSSGEERGYLSDAIAEGIITELSRFTEFFVIARNSSFEYQGTATDVREIARKLGVQYLLEGSQQKNGDRLRVTAQLIDALGGNHLWAETYDRDLADLFEVQDEIVHEIASAVGANIAFRSPPRGGLAKVSAMHYHLQARPHVREWSREGTRKGLELNLAAVEADPESPFGYIGLAFVYPRAQWGWLDIEGPEGLRRGEEAAEKALALDPDNYDAHFARGYVHTEAGEQELAIRRFRRALELNPNAANVMAAISSPLIYSGRAEEALDILEMAMRLDPYHPDWFKWNLAWAQWAIGDCEAALSTMQAMTNMPNRARRILAIIHVCLGDQAEAEATVSEFLKNEPNYTLAKVRHEDGARYTATSILDRYVEGLRQAGLPE